MSGGPNVPQCPACGTAAVLALVEVADQCALPRRAATWRCPRCGAALDRLEGRWRRRGADGALSAEIANERMAGA
jgi:hypothetical protein